MGLCGALLFNIFQRTKPTSSLLGTTVDLTRRTWASGPRKAAGAGAVESPQMESEETSQQNIPWSPGASQLVVDDR